MENSSMVIDHGVEGLPKGSIGFTATPDKDGRKIVINLKNGDKIPKVITVADDGPAISGFLPTPGGTLIYCYMDDGTVRRFVTATGQPFVKKTKASPKPRSRQ